MTIRIGPESHGGPAPAGTTSDSTRRAIVLGGGGVLGFAWILGALGAMEQVAGFDARSSDVVLGTSAGSVVAALLGLGLPAEVIARHHQGRPAAGDPEIAYDYDAATGGALPPWPGWRPAAPRLAWSGLRHPRGASPWVTLSGMLPVGRASLASVGGLVRSVAERAVTERAVTEPTDPSSSWPTRPRPWIVAMDYRTGRRVVFGRDGVARGADGIAHILRSVPIADAVVASCSIPGWYPPCVIDGVPYVDGGTASNASVDLLEPADVDEVYVLAPMASVVPDHPRRAVARVERTLRRGITRGIQSDVARLRDAGVRVVLVTPGPEDLAAMGLNLMDPSRREAVFDVARRTSAAQVADQLAPWGQPRTRAGEVDQPGGIIRA